MQLRQFGAPDEVIRAAQKAMKPTSATFEVHLDAWPSLEVFFGLMTQWNKVVIGGFSSPQKIMPLGLRYEALEPSLRLSKVFVPADSTRRLLRRSEWPDVFGDLKAMERVMIEHFSKGD